MVLTYDHLMLRYEPFPIGLAKPVMDRSNYEELVENYPPADRSWLDAIVRAGMPLT